MKVEKVNLTFEQKLELAQFIIKHNGGAITGSLMLKMRGIDLGRELDDIDIIIEPTASDDIILPPLCVNIETGEDNDGYKVLLRAMYFGNKIEFITVDKLYSDKINYKHQSFVVAKIEDLIAAKEEYLENDTHEEYLEKTRRDLEIIKNHLISCGTNAETGDAHR